MEVSASSYPLSDGFLLIKVGNGDLRATLDRWTVVDIPSIPQFHNLSVFDILSSHVQKSVMFNLASPDFLSYVGNISLDLEKKDTLIWRGSSSGLFSAKEYWDSTRIRGTTFPWSKYFWNKVLPTKMALFSWKLLNSAVPVDSVVMSLGFSMVSRCQCCEFPAAETLSHLFVTGQIATAVWTFFAPLFDLSWHN